MESWVAKKKRSKRQHNKSGYDNLPKDLQVNILNRLPAKDLSRAMCVSKTWCKLVLFTCFPMMLSLTVPLLRLLQRVESKTKHEIPPSWLSVFVDTLDAPHPYVGLDQLVSWCSRVTDCRFAARKLIDSCNGLLLFCHKSKIENNARAVFYYYVINPITKKCVAVLKPRPSTAGYTYAALAYDPTESEFFKIIGFQGLRQVNVFSSKTGNWTSIHFQLPLDVIGARWLKNSVYLKGAMYRLSSAGHLIKFVVDQQENPTYQAVAIRVPCFCPFNNCHWDIGVRHKKIVFFMSTGTCLMIWELVERFDGRAYIFNWCQTHRVIDSFLRELNGSGQLLAIHPYNAIAIFKYKKIIYYYFYCHNTKTCCCAIENVGPMSRYITSSGFLLLEYIIPCRLDKKQSGDFQWLPTIEDGRQVGVYTLAD